MRFGHSVACECEEHRSAFGAVCIERAADEMLTGDGWWCDCAENVNTCFIHMSRESNPTNVTVFTCCCHCLQAVVEHRDYHENEIAERQDRVANIDPGAVDVDQDADLEAADNIFGGATGVGEDDGLQEDGEEGAEQGGLGYQ